MTDKQDLIREIHEYLTTQGGENTATHLLVQAASAIQTQAAELEAVGAGGVQALSAAPAGWRELAAKVMDALADAQDTTNSQYPEHVRCYPSWERHARWLRWHADMFRSGNPVGNGAGNPDVLAALAASPTPPAEQQATKETSGGFHVWRDISTAPKDGSRFVATGHNYGLYSEVRHTCVAQWFRGCWMEVSDWNETSELKYLTHWMPLPSPPDDVAAPAEQQAAPKAAQADPGYSEKWDAELGRTAMRFVDRAGDVHPGIDDAETICAEFHKAMSEVIERMLHVRKMTPPKAAPVKACVCGESQTSGTVHRVDGPCYVAAPKEASGEPDRADATNLARNTIKYPDLQLTAKGVHCLAEAVLEMDNYIAHFVNATPQQEASQDTMYLLRRLLSNQHTLTGPEFRAELEKIVGETYQQEAQEPVAWQGVHDQTDLYYTKPLQADVRPLYAAPQPAPAELERLRERIARMGLDVDRAMRGHVNEQSPLGTQRLAAIAGTYGIDGYVAAPQPSPTTKPAPQQEAQEPCPTCVALARAVMLDQVSFDRKPDCYGIRQITDDESVEEWEDIRTSPDVAREEANDMMATGRGEIYEVVPLYATPQPAPAPLTRDQIREVFMAHGFTIKEGQTDLKQYVYDAAYALLGTKPAPLGDDVVKDAARYRWLRDTSNADDPSHMIALHIRDEQNDASLSGIDAAIDAALAAQGDTP